MHSVEIKIVGDRFSCPLHTYKNHVRGRTHQCLQAPSIEANSEIDQIGKRLITLVAVKESMPVHLNSSDSSVLCWKDPRHPTNVLRQLWDILRGNKGDSEPVALSPHIRLVDVTQQHAATPAAEV